MKLVRLGLHNFQSHPNTEVALSPGINAFVGASDQGKTAMLRGLSWLVNNSPSGDAIISDWARNEKGEILEPCYVETETTEEVVIRRIKSSKRNGYDVDDAVFNAIKTNVPVEVEDSLNLGPVNWQRQLDPPFLLAESGGARARFFNQLIRLEEVDQCMSMAESLRRKVAGAIPPLEADIQAGEKQLETLAWVDSQEKNLKLLEELLAGNQEANTRLERLTTLVEELREALQTIERLEYPVKHAGDLWLSFKDEQKALVLDSRSLNSLVPIRDRLKTTNEALQKTEQVTRFALTLKNIQTVQETAGQTDERKTRLQGIIRQLWDANRVLGDSPVDLGDRLIRLSRFIQVVQETETKKTAVQKLWTKLYVTNRDLTSYNKDITEIEAQLPDICPLCAGKGSMKEHTHG